MNKKITDSFQSQIDNAEFIKEKIEQVGGSFSGLSDTPSTLTEGSGQYLKVSDDGQAIEYVDAPSGGSSGGGSGTFSVAEHQKIKDLSNFDGPLPDVIFALDTAGTADMTPIYLRHINSSTVFYSSLADAVFVVFNNDADGTPTVENSGNISRMTHGKSLRDFIDDGDALFGSSSSSGGIGDNIHIQSESQFDQVIPSYIIMAGGTANTNGTGGKGLCIFQFRQFHLNDNTLQYYDVYKGDDYVWFNNDPHGTFNKQSNVGGFYSFHTTSQEPSLKELCDSNYAGFSSTSSNGSSTTPDAILSFNVFPITDQSDISEITIKCKSDYLKSVDPVNNDNITNITKFDVVDAAEASSLTSTTISNTNLFFVINDTLYYVTDGNTDSVGDLCGIGIYTDYNPSTPQVINFLVADVEITFTGNQNTPVLLEHINGYKSFVRNGITLSDGSPHLSPEIENNKGLFDGDVPNAISALTSNGAGRKILYLDHYGAGGAHGDEFIYSNHIDDGRFSVRFHANTTDGDWQLAERITKEGSGSLANYIANGQAFYFNSASSGSSTSSGSSSASTFTSLTDTPTELTADKYLKVNTEGTALELVSAPAGGSSSASGGAGSLQIIKDKSNFYTDLPDAIVWPHSASSSEAAGRAEAILHLKFVHEPETSGVAVDIFYECRDVNQGGVFLGFGFNNNSNGDYEHLYSNQAGFQDVPSATNSLKWFIENGRAIYYGSSSSSSLGNGITSLDITEDNISLVASGIKIPDSILVKDTNPSANLFINLHLGYIVTNSHFSYERDNGDGKRWYISFDVNTGSYKTHTADGNVSKEFNSIQEYITNGRATYYGGSSS